MVFTIWIKISRNSPTLDIILKSLDLVSIVVPPTLQGALTACLLYAQNRLRKEKIYCISPNTINVCGILNTFVFDKTGTLTEDDSDLKCVVPFKTGLNYGKEIESMGELESDVNYSRIIELMSSCNSITYINQKLDGDPLDLKLFYFTKWTLIEPTLDEETNFDMLMPTIVRPGTTTTSEISMSKLRELYEIGIIKQYPFLSSLQRMGVVIRCLNRSKFEFYCKGSPEAVISMCRGSSIPDNFYSVLSKYTRKGCRVLGMGYKILDDSFNLLKIEKCERDVFECDLEFLGLIILENKLKPQTTGVIRSLKIANIRPIMCTGDNLLTGISVSRECSILSKKDKVIFINAEKDLNKQPKFVHSDLNFDTEIENYELFAKENENINFAVDGKSFEIIRNNYPIIFKDLIKNGTIFATFLNKSFAKFCIENIKKSNSKENNNIKR